MKNRFLKVLSSATLALLMQSEANGMLQIKSCNRFFTNSIYIGGVVNTVNKAIHTGEIQHCTRKLICSLEPNWLKQPGLLKISKDDIECIRENLAEFAKNYPLASEVYPRIFQDRAGSAIDFLRTCKYDKNSMGLNVDKSMLRGYSTLLIACRESERHGMLWRDTSAYWPCYQYYVYGTKYKPEKY